MTAEPATIGMDAQTVALVRLAAAVAQGDEALIRECADAAFTVDMPSIWGDELILQSVLMVGWPRALVAAAIWREVAGDEATGRKDRLAAERSEWLELGEDVCRTIYGRNYDRLRANVRALHPALDDWMVRHGYGRTLSRPGLSLARRELCTVAQTAVLDTPRQLHSHLQGALNAGASPEWIDSTLSAIAEVISGSGLKNAQALWQRLRGREIDSR